MNIEGRTIRLRAVEPEDADLMYPLSLRSSQRRSCMLVAPFMGARSFPAVSLLPLNWIISYFPQSWKFLIFTLNSYFVDIRHRAQKCSMIQVVHRWIIPIE